MIERDLQTVKMICVLVICILLISLVPNFVESIGLQNTEYQEVEVTIVDEHYQAHRVIPVHAGKVTTMITHPARCEIIVDYNGKEYVINDENTYNQYKERIGETTTGTLQVKTYQNGQQISDIISLSSQETTQ